MIERTYYLVVRGGGDARIAKKPRLAQDEVAFKVVVEFPPGWGRVDTGTELRVRMPEPPEAWAETDGLRHDER